MTRLNTENNQDQQLVRQSASSWMIPVVITLFLYLLTERLWAAEWLLVIKLIYAVSLHLVILKLYEFFFVNSNSLKTKAEPHPAYSWPMPGPFKHWGVIGKILPYVTYYGSTLLTTINPFLLVQQIKMIAGQSRTSARLKGKGLQIANYQTKVSYRLPFDGEWLVYHGGHTPETSHSWDVLNQRYAYDFVIADKEFNRHVGTGIRLTDYHCYQQPILAAASGEIISITNHIKDAPFIGYFVMDFLTTGIAGNHVIIKHAEGEYGFYAHLIKDSIKLKKGDIVKQGEFIGFCGHSGNSSEPHLHFHLQDQDNFFNSMGLPVKFSGVSINEELPVDDAVLHRATRVKNVSL